MRRIYLSPPDIREPEVALLGEAVESGWAAPAGPAIEAFEADLARSCGVPHAIALSSGTAALHLALLLAGVGSGDDVLLPTFTFVSSANAVSYCGARPCFVDSERRTWNMSIELLLAELRERRSRGTLPAAIVTVDLYGQCAAYDDLVPLCDELEIPLIEDAAEALGASWCDAPAGSFGRFGVLSFNGNKVITTTGGGALLCHDEVDANRARYLATQSREPVTHYEHVELGYNYRLSNLLAAFGRGQLATLDDRINRRRAIRTRYSSELGGLPGVRFAPEDQRGRSNAWLTCMTLDPVEARCGPRDLEAVLEERDIEARPLWKPMHLQPLYAQNPARVDGTASELFATGLCLPSGSGLTDRELDRVIEVASGALR